jgi:hypothetical protein
MATIGNPPRISLKFGRNGIVQLPPMTNVDFLIETAMNDHDGTIDVRNAINIRINVQASQNAVRMIERKNVGIESNVSKKRQQLLEDT